MSVVLFAGHDSVSNRLDHSAPLELERFWLVGATNMGLRWSRLPHAQGEGQALPNKLNEVFLALTR
jgi:hypothetical protein